jgi:hypothetical protein
MCEYSKGPNFIIGKPRKKPWQEDSTQVQMSTVLNPFFAKSVERSELQVLNHRVGARSTRQVVKINELRRT